MSLLRFLLEIDTEARIARIQPFEGGTPVRPMTPPVTSSGQDGSRQRKQSEIVRVLAQRPPARGTCRSCGAPISWFETLKGKKIPFDGHEVTYVKEQTLDDGRIVWLLKSSTCHFVTCPQGQQWSKH